MLRTRFGQRVKVSVRTLNTIESDGMHRASGECVCGECFKAYWKHCNLEPPYDFLTLLCDGSVVKL